MERIIYDLSKRLIFWLLLFFFSTPTITSRWTEMSAANAMQHYTRLSRIVKVVRIILNPVKFSMILLGY